LSSGSTNLRVWTRTALQMAGCLHVVMKEGARLFKTSESVAAPHLALHLSKPRSRCGC
jgi:hypothetical protein